jgi:hypothetical protein
MMPAGKYYVGDLCYVMDDKEWEEFCSITIKDQRCLEGEFVMSDGRRFAVYGTRYGDGIYQDQHHNNYSVDAGSIGCIKVEDIKAKKYNDIERLGKFHEFERDFTTSGGRDSGDWDGVICIGGVKIKTDSDYEESENMTGDVAYSLVVNESSRIADLLEENMEEGYIQSVNVNGFVGALLKEALQVSQDAEDSGLPPYQAVMNHFGIEQ